jgi:hypothetical protein
MGVSGETTSLTSMPTHSFERRGASGAWLGLIHWLRLHVLHLRYRRWGRHDCWSWSGLMGGGGGDVGSYGEER